MFKSLIVVVATVAAINAHAATEESFAALALKSGGAVVGECPSQVLTKDEVLASKVETGIFKVTTQTKINGSKASAYVINPVIKPSKRGCVYQAQKVDVTKAGSLTLKKN